MKIEDLFGHVFEQVNRSKIYYHGTNNQFDDFNIEAGPVNRATNVAGVYFTPREYEAEGYGSRVIQAKLSVRKPFHNRKKNIITEAMKKKMKELLLRYTNYKEHWLDSAIIPDFEEKGNFSSMGDIKGEIKREILIAGGYDSYIDGDHVVILTPTKSNIQVVGS